MAWYYGTYKCGHDGRTNIGGPIKDRERKSDWEFSRECEECRIARRKAEIEEENKRSAELAVETRLPELVGSPKQIAWANTIRQDFIDKYHEVIERGFVRFKEQKSNLSEEVIADVERQKVEIPLTYDFLLQQKTKASFWIDNRSNAGSPGYLLNEYKTDAIDHSGKLAEKEKEAIAMQDIKIESTVSPKEKEYDGVVEVTVEKDVVIIEYERNDCFRELVRELGYRWRNQAWRKDISEMTGTSEERASELGNVLLNEGFSVMIVDEDVRSNAINGDFEPECKRWIKNVVGSDLFAIYWDREYDLYDVARSLPESRWKDGRVIIKLTHYLAVEEFAEYYHFKFTKAARSMIDNYVDILEKARVVDPVKVNNTIDDDKIEEILESEVGVLDDLKDDDV